jgi:ribA/ribD-fused uncharacterized protein
MSAEQPQLMPSITKVSLPDPLEFSEFVPFIKGVFSQWHYTPFQLEGRQFVTAEQWMMHAKALLFGDHGMAEKIAVEDDPAVQKRLGQQVRDFDQNLWDQWKIEIVYRGNLAKFSQNEGAKRQLRNTREALLVEANPRDWIWGDGREINYPRGHSPAVWLGENLLGLILTKVRIDLLNH